MSFKWVGRDETSRHRRYLSYRAKACKCMNPSFLTTAYPAASFSYTNA